MNITTLYYKKPNSHPIQIIKLDPFNYCKVIKKSITNPMMKLMISFMNETQPGILHDCPYKVQ